MKRADFKFDPLREVKLVPDVLLNFQLTLDRLILFFMQICLHKVVTFIGLSAPCSQLRAWKFQRTEQNILGPDITETIVTAPLKVHIFCEGHKILRNLHCRFDWHYIGQIYSGGFAKLCGPLRIYRVIGFKLINFRIIIFHD